MSYMQPRIEKLESCMLQMLAEFGVHSGRDVINDACTLMEHPQAHEWREVKLSECEYQQKIHYLKTCFCGNKDYEPFIVGESTKPIEDRPTEDSLARIKVYEETRRHFNGGD